MKEVFRKRKLVKYIGIVKKIHINISEVHVYVWLHIESIINPLLGTKLGFFLVRSTFPPAHASLWPERSGATT